jgi:hypothetical protein
MLTILFMTMINLADVKYRAARIAGWWQEYCNQVLAIVKFGKEMPVRQFVPLMRGIGNEKRPCQSKTFIKIAGAQEGTRTPTPCSAST